MGKKLTILVTLSISVLTAAQVGIKKDSPHPSADLELGSENKSLLLNRVPNTAAVSNPVNGMMIYDLSEECVKAYQNGKWSKCLGKSARLQRSLKPLLLSCNSASLSPALKEGQLYSGSLDIPYSGGNGLAYEKKVIKTNGLTAVLPAGKFEKGDGNLKFAVTGMPEKSDGTAFNVVIAEKACSIVTK